MKNFIQSIELKDTKLNKQSMEKRANIELSETIAVSDDDDEFSRFKISHNDPSTNRSPRDILNTENPNAIRIYHRAKISEKYGLFLKAVGICLPTSCLLCNTDKYLQSTYAQIHENRVEYNYPSASFIQAFLTCLGCNRFDDDVKVYYFDKNIGENASHVKCCSPICTHNFCFPECFGMCGESVALYSNGSMGGLCCRRYVMINGLDDADRFVAEYQRAKYERITI